MRLRRHVRVGASRATKPTLGDSVDREARILSLNLAARRQTPPNAIARGPLVAEPGFGVAIVAIVRDEERHLEEWLAFHLALGVDHVFLYDNRSTDGSAELLERYIDHGLVTRLDWPQPAGQRAAYNHALRMFGSVAEWLVYIDVDEFFVPLVDDDIPSVLARFPHASDVRIPRRELAFSGHRTPPAGLTIESYTQVADVFSRGPDAPPRVKTALRPRAIAAMDVHLALVAEPGTVPEGLTTVEEGVGAIAQVNHYYTRSFEEYEAKRVGGSATGRHERAALPFDIPTLAIDESAFRFRDRTLAYIAEMRSLDPRPHAYGSRLRLAHFPRANDLGRHGEVLIATIAARLDDPMGYGKVRIRNLYPGIGFVGDLGKAGRAPVAGALSGSSHLEQLLVPVRATLDATLPLDGTPAREVRSREEPLELALPATELRRCYGVGFLVEGDAPARLELRLERDDGTLSEPVRVELRRASTYAGIVELTDRASHGRRVVALLDSSAPVRVFDLFGISYG